MAQFSGHRMLTRYTRPSVLGRVASVVFLLGHIRSQVLRMCRCDGHGRHMYTVILDVKVYGVFVYPVCVYIVYAYILCFLQLFRTSCLRPSDSQELFGQL
jgi:hypothetical protein